MSNYKIATIEDLQRWADDDEEALMELGRRALGNAIVDYTEYREFRDFDSEIEAEMRFDSGYESGYDDAICNMQRTLAKKIDTLRTAVDGHIVKDYKDITDAINQLISEIDEQS